MYKPKKYRPKQYNPNSKSNPFVLHIVKPLLPEHPNVHVLPISTQSRCPAIQCTLSCGEGLASFRVPYPMANLPTASTTFVHSPNPCLITRDTLLVSITQTLNPAEEEYLCTFQLAP